MRKKFLAWLLTVAMVFNIALPYTAFAEDMLIDIDSSYSASETETDNDATNEVDGDTPTADVPTTADEQEPVVDEPAADGDNDAESDGKEVDQPAAAVPAQDEPKQDEPAAADEADEEADEPADDEPLAEEPLADEVASLLGNFAAQAVSDGIMPVADTVVSGGTLQFSKDLDAEYVVPYENPGYTKLTLTVGT